MLNSPGPAELAGRAGSKISTALPPIVAVDINDLLAEDSVTIEIGNH